MLHRIRILLHDSKVQVLTHTKETHPQILKGLLMHSHATKLPRIVEINTQIVIQSMLLEI